jgi:hypothetical protein
MPARPFNSYCVPRILVHAETRRRGGFDRAQVRFLIRLRGFAASRDQALIRAEAQRARSLVPGAILVWYCVPGIPRGWRLSALSP